MDTIHPWLDPSEVRHLAEQLLRPVAPARIHSADPGFDSSFIGFTTEDIGTALAEPTAQRCTPPVLPQTILFAEQPSLTPPPIPATSSSTRFLERIAIFRDWLSKNFQAAEIFILDHEGKVIFDESGHGRFHFMARNLASAPQASGNVHVKIGPAAMLQIIPCETPHGRIVLGTLLPEALSTHHLHTITELLIQTASPA